mgnify:CR=1 FL=1
MDKLVAYAKEELTRAGLFRKDSDYSGLLGKAALKMVKQFAKEGHSGMSASLALEVFKRLASWEPLTPLTGQDDEWNAISVEMGTPNLFQNKRCSRVFKENGVAYDQDGKVFREPTGRTYTNRDSRVLIIFPYTPKTEIVDVEESP